MMIGLTTPERFVFDEVHYVPAARQMLEPAMPQPMLNPMHPPLAKQLMALSIRTFGDGPFAWRYPSVLFGSLAIVAIYLCGLALFAAQGPALASALLAFFNQMVFVQSRIAMLDIYALAFGLFGVAAFVHGYREPRPQRCLRARGIGFRPFRRLQMERIVSARHLNRHRRRDPPDAGLAYAVRRRHGGRLVSPDLWPDFKWFHFIACFVLIPAITYLATFVPLYGLSLADILEAQRKIFGDNVTSAFTGHTYMSAWPSWPFLVRPVWYLFDKTSDDRIAAVVFLGNPLGVVAGAGCGCDLPA